MNQDSDYQQYLAKKQQIAALEAETKILLQAFLDSQISEIKNKIKEFNIRPEQLFTAQELPNVKKTTGKRGTVKKAKSTKTDNKTETIKYRGPNGETWGGGRGRKPAWVQTILDAGGEIEKYRIA